MTGPRPRVRVRVVRVWGGRAGAARRAGEPSKRARSLPTRSATPLRRAVRVPLAHGHSSMSAPGTVGHPSVASSHVMLTSCTYGSPDTPS